MASPIDGGQSLWPSEVRQIDEPYHSTIAFEDFVRTRGGFRSGGSVLDVGTGIGANLFYFRRKNPGSTFVGFDYNPDKIATGQWVRDHFGGEGIALQTADIWNLPPEWTGAFDGVTVIHTLCVFKQIEPVLDRLLALQPRWLAINSLFYEGPLDVLIHIRSHEHPHIADDNPDGDFNIFSLTRLGDFLAARGYRMASEPFYPPQPLPRPAGGSRGTYTMATELSERTQFSGPVHLPWRFVFAERD